MIHILTPRGWTAVITAALAALASLGLAVSAKAFGDIALINETPSLPKGLYVRLSRAPLERGVIAASVQPQRARPYLAELGAPADLLLIKRVAGIEGDWICQEEGRLLIPTGAVEVQAIDRGGRSLPQWEECRHLRSGEIFLLGETANSFDSRYFGPVRREEVRGVYRAVLTW